MNYENIADKISALVEELKKEASKCDKGVSAAQVRYRRKLSDIINECKEARAKSLSDE